MSITSDAVKHEINGLCASQIKVWFKDHNDRRALNYEQIAIQVHQLLVRVNLIFICRLKSILICREHLLKRVKVTENQWLMESSAR
ncbi:hypothetical protein bas46_0191 [Escherichia phage ChristianSchoenbein]|nr:hypothetical protein bas46_0191 [Escherichia phage ChristianSchoenbein]